MDYYDNPMMQHMIELENEQFGNYLKNAMALKRK